MKHWLQSLAQSAHLEWQHLKRSQWDQAVLIWLPLISIAMLWWTFAAAQPEHIPIAVVDHDRSSESRTLIRMLDAAAGLDVHQAPLDERSAQEAMRAVDVYAVVIIPDDFSQRIKSSKSAPVSLRVNAQYGTHSGIIQRDVRQVIATFSAGVEQQLRLALGEPSQTMMANIRPLVVDAPFGFNITTNYQAYIAATLIPALLHILATIAGAYSIGRELRDKILHKSYAVSADRPSLMGIIAYTHGKICWSVLAFSLWGIATLALITYYESLSHGAWWLCFIAMHCLIVLSIWLGILLAAVPISLRMGLSAAALITAPAYALSGTTFPLSQMPIGAQSIANMLPLTHYLHAQMMLVEMRATAAMVLPIVASMALASIALMLLANVATYRALRSPKSWGKR